MLRVLIPALAFGGAAFAQETLPTPSSSESANGTVTYETDFFKEFSPQNALDMVARVPGFSIDGGSDRRGFGGAAGNVLIDGARPSIKSQGLRDILSRIPANQVERVELIRGAQTGEAAGQSVLVNIVRKPSAGSGNWVGALERSGGDRYTPSGEISYAGRRGKTEYTIGLERDMQHRPLAGSRTLRNAAGAVTGTRVDITPRTWRQAEGAFSLSTPVMGGQLNLNGQTSRWAFETTFDSFGFGATGAPSDSFRYEPEERRRGRELGGDYERAFGDWTLKLVALDTIGWYSNDERTTSANAVGATTEILDQRRRNRNQESIVRATASRPMGEGRRLEFGGELARNALETNLNLTRNVGAGPVVVPLNGANIEVSEDRGEAFVTYVMPLTDRWTFEGAATVESSILSVSGDSPRETELTYWKPSLQLNRKIGEKDQLRVRLFRDVSQLDFGDFASVAQTLDDRIAAGNPDLRPQVTDRLSVTYDKRFGEKGALTFTLIATQAEDVQDSVPVGGFDAPGNIGDGEAFGGEIKLTWPMDAVLKGALLEVAAGSERTEVTDPVTRRLRRASGNEGWVNVDFRQDLPALKLAWGLSYFKESEITTFRVSEIDVYEEGPFVDAFVETTAIKGAKVRFFAWNLDDTLFQRQRNFYLPDRNAPFSRSELRQRQFGRFYGVRISGTF